MFTLDYFVRFVVTVRFGNVFININEEGTLLRQRIWNLFLKQYNKQAIGLLKGNMEAKFLTPLLFT